MDETDYALPQDLAEKSDASIMIIGICEVFDNITDKMEKAGVFVFLKPVNKTVLLSVLRFDSDTKASAQHPCKKTAL